MIQAVRRQYLTGLAKGLLHRIGAPHIARLTGPRNSLVRILAYHSVSPPNDYCIDTIRVSPSLFEKHICFLNKHYNVISLDQVIDCLRDKQPFPEHAVAITFDDGYLDNYEHALPVLNKYGATATFFVVSSVVKENAAFWVGWLQNAINNCPQNNAIEERFANDNFDGSKQTLIDLISVQINTGNRQQRQKLLAEVAALVNCTPWHSAQAEDMMGIGELRALAQAGMTIGSHTESHAIMSSLSDAAMTEELQNSKNDLEDLLQTEVNHLAFPNGPGVINCDARTARLAAKAGYRSAATSRRGVVRMDSDLHLLPRHSIHEVFDLGSFSFKLEEHRFSYLLLQGSG